MGKICDICSSLDASVFTNSYKFTDLFLYTFSTIMKSDLIVCYNLQVLHNFFICNCQYIKIHS